MLAHPDWKNVIGEIRAIEPSEGMREQFSKTVLDKRVSIADGTFDTTGVEDGWADLVVAAQARQFLLPPMSGSQLVILGISLVPRL